MEHQHPLLAELEALLPAASLRPHAVTCVDSCRSLLAEGAIEDADASGISFVTPTGSVRVEIPNGVDDAFLFALYRQCSSFLLNEQRAMLVKAVVTNSLARQRTSRINCAWHLYFQRQLANDSAVDEIGLLASISTAEELRLLTDKVKATALELPPPSKVRVTVILSAVPVWTAQTGELRLGDKAVHFRNQPRGLVRTILDTFQTSGWPSWIDGKKVADNLKPAAPTSHDDNGRDLRVRDAAATLRKKTAGWIAWHAEADNHLSWEPV